MGRTWDENDGAAHRTRSENPQLDPSVGDVSSLSTSIHHVIPAVRKTVLPSPYEGLLTPNSSGPTQHTMRHRDGGIAGEGNAPALPQEKACAAAFE